jgi:glycosyltransferase involved in cell wall biosynthesis
MKINIVLNTFPRSSESFLVSWINLLIDKKYNVNLVILENKKITTNHSVSKSALITKRLDLNVLLNAAFEFLKTRDLRLAYYTSLFSAKSPDIIHFSYTSIPSLQINSLIGFRLKGIKTVVSCRGHSENVRPYIDSSRYQKLKELFESIDSVHCVSQEMVVRMMIDFALDRNKGFVNRPAINIDLFKFRHSIISFNSSKKWIIITNGRLTSLKGYIFAFLALKKLKQLKVEFEYHIIGEGPEKDNTLFYIERLGLKENVKLMGTMSSDDVKVKLSESDIYLSCSLNEGISNAVMEAMAVGVPVISTSVNGMPELVFDGITGILVEPFCAEPITEAILKIARDNKFRMDIVNNARKLIEKEFHLGRLGEVFDAEYRRLNV